MSSNEVNWKAKYYYWKAGAHVLAMVIMFLVAYIFIEAMRHA